MESIRHYSPNINHKETCSLNTIDEESNESPEDVTEQVANVNSTSRLRGIISNCKYDCSLIINDYIKDTDGVGKTHISPHKLNFNFEKLPPLDSVSFSTSDVEYPIESDDSVDGTYSIIEDIPSDDNRAFATDSDVSENSDTYTVQKPDHSQFFSITRYIDGSDATETIDTSKPNSTSSIVISKSRKTSCSIDNDIPSLSDFSEDYSLNLTAPIAADESYLTSEQGIQNSLDNEMKTSFIEFDDSQSASIDTASNPIIGLSDVFHCTETPNSSFENFMYGSSKTNVTVRWILENASQSIQKLTDISKSPVYELTESDIDATKIETSFNADSTSEQNNSGFWTSTDLLSTTDSSNQKIGHSFDVSSAIDSCNEIRGFDSALVATEMSSEPKLAITTEEEAATISDPVPDISTPFERPFICEEVAQKVINIYQSQKNKFQSENVNKDRIRRKTATRDLEYNCEQSSPLNPSISDFRFKSASHSVLIRPRFEVKNENHFPGQGKHDRNFHIFSDQVEPSALRNSSHYLQDKVIAGSGQIQRPENSFVCQPKKSEMTLPEGFFTIGASSVNLRASSSELKLDESDDVCFKSRFEENTNLYFEEDRNKLMTSDAASSQESFDVPNKYVDDKVVTESEMLTNTISDNLLFQEGFTKMRNLQTNKATEKLEKQENLFAHDTEDSFMTSKSVSGLTGEASMQSKQNLLPNSKQQLNTNYLQNDVMTESEKFINKMPKSILKISREEEILTNSNLLEGKQGEENLFKPNPNYSFLKPHVPTFVPGVMSADIDILKQTKQYFLNSEQQLNTPNHFLDKLVTGSEKVTNIKPESNLKPSRTDASGGNELSDTQKSSSEEHSDNMYYLQMINTSDQRDYLFDYSRTSSTKTLAAPAYAPGITSLNIETPLECSSEQNVNNLNYPLDKAITGSEKVTNLMSNSNVKTLSQKHFNTLDHLQDKEVVETEILVKSTKLNSNLKMSFEELLSQNTSKNQNCFSKGTDQLVKSENMSDFEPKCILTSCGTIFAPSVRPSRNETNVEGEVFVESKQTEMTNDAVFHFSKCSMTPSERPFVQAVIPFKAKYPFPEENFNQHHVQCEINNKYENSEYLDYELEKISTFNPDRTSSNLISPKQCDLELLSKVLSASALDDNNFEDIIIEPPDMFKNNDYENNTIIENNPVVKPVTDKTSNDNFKQLEDFFSDEADFGTMIQMSHKKTADCHKTPSTSINDDSNCKIEKSSLTKAIQNFVISSSLCSDLACLKLTDPDSIPLFNAYCKRGKNDCLTSSSKWNVIELLNNFLPIRALDSVNDESKAENMYETSDSILISKNEYTSPLGTSTTTDNKFNNNFNSSMISLLNNCNNIEDTTLCDLLSYLNWLYSLHAPQMPEQNIAKNIWEFTRKNKHLTDQFGQKSSEEIVEDSEIQYKSSETLDEKVHLSSISEFSDGRFDNVVKTHTCDLDPECILSISADDGIINHTTYPMYEEYLSNRTHDNGEQTPSNNSEYEHEKLEFSVNSMNHLPKFITENKCVTEDIDNADSSKLNGDRDRNYAHRPDFRKCARNGGGIIQEHFRTTDSDINRGDIRFAKTISNELCGRTCPLKDSNVEYRDNSLLGEIRLKNVATIQLDSNLQVESSHLLKHSAQAVRNSNQGKMALSDLHRKVVEPASNYISSSNAPAVVSQHSENVQKQNIVFGMSRRQTYEQNASGQFDSAKFQDNLATNSSWPQGAAPTLKPIVCTNYKNIVCQNFTDFGPNNYEHIGDNTLAGYENSNCIFHGDRSTDETRPGATKIEQFYARNPILIAKHRNLQETGDPEYVIEVHKNSELSNKKTIFDQHKARTIKENKKPSMKCVSNIKNLKHQGYPIRCNLKPSDMKKKKYVHQGKEKAVSKETENDKKMCHQSKRVALPVRSLDPVGDQRAQCNRNIKHPLDQVCTNCWVEYPAHSFANQNRRAIRANQHNIASCENLREKELFTSQDWVYATDNTNSDKGDRQTTRFGHTFFVNGGYTAGKGNPIKKKTDSIKEDDSQNTSRLYTSTHQNYSELHVSTHQQGHPAANVSHELVPESEFDFSNHRNDIEMEHPLQYQHDAVYLMTEDRNVRAEHLLESHGTEKITEQKNVNKNEQLFRLYHDRLKKNDPIPNIAVERENAREKCVFGGQTFLDPEKSFANRNDRLDAVCDQFSKECPFSGPVTEPGAYDLQQLDDCPPDEINEIAEYNSITGYETNFQSDIKHGVTANLHARTTRNESFECPFSDTAAERDNRTSDNLTRDSQQSAIYKSDKILETAECSSVIEELHSQFDIQQGDTPNSDARSAKNESLECPFSRPLTKPNVWTSDRLPVDHAEIRQNAEPEHSPDLRNRDLENSHLPTASSRSRRDVRNSLPDAISTEGRPPDPHYASGLACATLVSNDAPSLRDMTLHVELSAAPILLEFVLFEPFAECLRESANTDQRLRLGDPELCEHPQERNEPLSEPVREPTPVDPDPDDFAMDRPGILKATKRGSKKGRKKHRVQFDESSNKFFEADYVILLREECECGGQFCDDECNDFESDLDFTFDPPLEFDDEVTLSPPDGYKDGCERECEMQECCCGVIAEDYQNRRKEVPLQDRKTKTQEIANDAISKQDFKDQGYSVESNASQMAPYDARANPSRFIVETVTMTTVTEHRIIQDTPEYANGGILNINKCKPEEEKRVKFDQEPVDTEKTKSDDREFTLTFNLGNRVVPCNSLKPNSAVRQLFPDARFTDPPIQNGTEVDDNLGKCEGKYLVTEESLRAFNEVNKRSVFATFGGKERYPYRDGFTIHSDDEDMPQNNLVKKTIERNTLRRSLMRHPHKKMDGMKKKLELSLEERIKMLTCNIDEDEGKDNQPNIRENEPDTSKSTAPSTSKKLADFFNRNRPECQQVDPHYPYYQPVYQQGQPNVNVVLKVQQHQLQHNTMPQKPQPQLIPQKPPKSTSMNESRKQFLSSLAPLAACVTGHAEHEYSNRESLKLKLPGDRNSVTSVTSNNTEYSLGDINDVLDGAKEEQPDVVVGTPVGGDVQDELVAFVQQDAGRIERIKKRYSQTPPTCGSDEDEHDDYGFTRRPSVRGVKAKFGSTTEILQQMQSQLQSPLLVCPTKTGSHMTWPYYSAECADATNKMPRKEEACAAETAKTEMRDRSQQKIPLQQPLRIDTGSYNTMHVCKFIPSEMPVPYKCEYQVTTVQKDRRFPGSNLYQTMLPQPSPVQICSPHSIPDGQYVAHPVPVDTAPVIHIAQGQQQNICLPDRRIELVIQTPGQPVHSLVTFSNQTATMASSSSVYQLQMAQTRFHNITSNTAPKTTIAPSEHPRMQRNYVPQSPIPSLTSSPTRIKPQNMEQRGIPEGAVSSSPSLVQDSAKPMQKTADLPKSGSVMYGMKI